MNKFSGYLILFYFIIFTAIAIFSAPLAKFLLTQFFNVTNDSNDWIGFAGNILGGILGGMATLLGVMYAFYLERKNAVKENTPDKILSLYELKDIILSHKFTRNYSISSTKQESENNVIECLEELQNFTKKKNEVLKSVSKVDTEIFAVIDYYYKSINVISYKLKEILKNKNNYTRDDINLEISNATRFQTDLIVKVNNVVKKRTNIYVNEFHNRRKSKKLLNDIDNHDYLSNS